MIKESRHIPLFTSTQDFENYLPTSPVLSSRERGWEDLMVRFYHEPADLEETIFPGSADIYLVLITSGAVQAAERDLDGPWSTQLIQAGDWYLSPAGGGPYALRWKSLSDEPLKTLHLHLSADVFRRMVQQVGDRDPQRVILQELTGFQDPLLTQLALSLQQELQAPVSDSVGKLYAQTAAQLLTTHLLRCYVTSSISVPEYRGKLSSRQMRRLSMFIQEHLNQNLSLELLAQQVGFSPYHFARLFRQTTGISPHRFVLQERLVAAERLLKETDWPLAQIAAEIGISNQSYFTQTFKRHKGITPLLYRQLR
ncbi:AraC family transcriptional regulator [Ktedonosporobacter rubrisoli]|nr:AraC family transcriptional regulator [Ktedonosporobacter rubrisoli]